MAKKLSFRAQRVGEVLRQELGELLQSIWLPFQKKGCESPEDEGRQKFLGDLGVIIGRIEVSGDLSQVRAFVFSSKEVCPQEEMVSFLNKNIKKIRFELTQRVNLRYAPSIKFFADDSFQRQERLNELFDKIALS